MTDFTLFLHRIETVAGSPLTFVAFLALVLAWSCRWYFQRTLGYIEAVRQADPKSLRPEVLSFLERLILGFPKSMTRNHMTVLGWRYKFAAYVATLVCFVIVAAEMTVWAHPDGPGTAARILASRVRSQLDVEDAIEGLVSHGEPTAKDFEAIRELSHHFETGDESKAALGKLNGTSRPKPNNRDTSRKVTEVLSRLALTPGVDQQAISLFGLALRNLRGFEAISGLERLVSAGSFRLSTGLRNVGPSLCPS